MGHVTQGDQRAFDELYQRYSTKLLHYFYRMLNQEEARAQDLLQDLFMKVIEKPQLFDPNRRFSTWLFAIASNMVKNEYRSRQVRSVMTYPEDLSQVNNQLDLSTETLEEALTLTHFGHCLQAELQYLSQAHREVFILRYQENLSIREIGEIMTCLEGTVKSRLFYALRNLAQRLKVFDPKG
jgi:RNA polymerase sigma-70 factor (ECF subfamily)